MFEKKSQNYEKFLNFIPQQQENDGEHTTT